ADRIGRVDRPVGQGLEGRSRATEDLGSEWMDLVPRRGSGSRWRRLGRGCFHGLRRGSGRGGGRRRARVVLLRSRLGGRRLLERKQAPDVGLGIARLHELLPDLFRRERLRRGARRQEQYQLNDREEGGPSPPPPRCEIVGFAHFLLEWLAE